MAADRTGATPVDIFIIGGGINGCGIAREQLELAAATAPRVALVGQADPGPQGGAEDGVALPLREARAVFLVVDDGIAHGRSPPGQAPPVIGGRSGFDWPYRPRLRRNARVAALALAAASATSGSALQ